MSKKIVFFDIDGTIYDYRRGIPQDVPSSIKKLRENGNLAVICTGRTRVMVFEKILKMGFDGIIGGGGTYVEYKSKVLFDKSLPNEVTDGVIFNMRKYGFYPIPEGTKKLYFDEETMINNPDGIFKVYEKEIPDKIAKIEKGKVFANKVSGRFTPASNIEGIKKELSERFKIVNHENRLLELIPNEYTKATGIKMLIDHLGIRLEDTYAFGDSFNDSEMLTYVRHGIAMGNASDELKSIVKYRTDDLFENGISNALKEFGLI